MKFFSYKKVTVRAHVILAIVLIVAVLIIVRIVSLMYINNADWEKAASMFVRDSITIRPERGSIYSADGQLLTTTLPKYRMYLDYIATSPDSVEARKLQHARDTLFDTRLDSMAGGLARIFPDKDSLWFYNRLLEGKKNAKAGGPGRRRWSFYPRRVNYEEWRAVCELPYFNRRTGITGLVVEEFRETVKPFGSLASRTLGDITPVQDSTFYGRPRSGLLLRYDSLMCGVPGLKHRQKELKKWVDYIDVPVQDGYDIITTIDTRLQEFCERTLREKVIEKDADEGMVILMEAKTGDIKAIVNLQKASDGNYYENRPSAMSNLMEPGSVFKPMSIMVAMEDGYVGLYDKVPIGGGGVRMMYGCRMTDWNRGQGGYGVLDVMHVIANSSNIGVSSIIDKYYSHNPQKFIDGLRRIGVGEDLHLDVPGYAVPRLPQPSDKNRIWSKTDLPWMSIGYVSQMPPISVLSFYNGVANGGKMMRPRLVSKIMREGEVVQEIAPQVVREQMCSAQTLQNIRAALRCVVIDGVGNRAESAFVTTAGKTGTAQVWTRGGRTSNYLVSFAGFFPYENPEYSCIVCMRIHTTGGGNSHSAPVFRKIAEMVTQSKRQPTIDEAIDSLHPPMPYVAGGNLTYANAALRDLGISATADFDTSTDNALVWGAAQTASQQVRLTQATPEVGKVPNLLGLGARDAVFLLERLGLRVQLRGMGVVRAQSLPVGQAIKHGQTITLTLAATSSKEIVIQPDQPEPAAPNLLADSTKTAQTDSTTTE